MFRLRIACENERNNAANQNEAPESRRSGSSLDRRRRHLPRSTRKNSRSRRSRTPTPYLPPARTAPQSVACGGNGRIRSRNGSIGCGRLVNLSVSLPSTRHQTIATVMMCGRSKGFVPERALHDRSGTSKNLRSLVGRICRNLPPPCRSGCCVPAYRKT